MREFLRALFAFVERDAAGRLAYRYSFVFDTLAAIFFFSSLYFVGKIVPPELIHGRDYFTTTTIGVGLFAFLGAVSSAPRAHVTNEIGFGVFETLLTVGPPLAVQLLAVSFLHAARAFLRLLIVIGVAWWFGVAIRPAGFAFFLALTAVVFVVGLGSGFLQAALELRTKDVRRIGALFSGALSLLTGVYFPVELLPAPLVALARLIPATHAIRAARRSLLDGALPLFELSVLLIFAGLFCLAGFLALRRSRKLMLMDGSYLTQ